MNDKSEIFAQNIAQKTRENGINTAIDYSGRKIGDQIKYADKNKIPFVVIIGDNEVKTGKIKVKELSTGIETETTADKISEIISK